MPQPVRRVVSLAPNLTETIFALGLGDLLVGDTDYCNYPPEALQKAHVGGPVNPSLEEIMALHPDLILATRDINRLVTVQALAQLGVAVYVTDPRTVDQVLSSTQRLSGLLGASEQASKLVASLHNRLQQLGERLSGSEPRSVFFITWVDPLISVGRDTFLADALRLAGARSVIATPEDWPNINLEQVLHLQPEYLIFSSDDPGQIQHQVTELRGRAGWQGLEALRQNRIIILQRSLQPSRAAPGGYHRKARACAARRQVYLRAPGSAAILGRSVSYLLVNLGSPLTMRPLTLGRVLRICALLSVVLVAVVLLALRLGAVPFSLGDLGQNLWWLASGHPEKLSTDFRLIMVDIRLPRILLGIFVGAALSVAGASFQALLRNPLADPYVLGVSNGAALGVLVALLVAPALPFMTPLAAFLGATTTISAVYLLGRRQGQLDSSTLLLAGIITASFLSAIIMFLMTTLASRDLRGIAFWLMGDLSTALPRGLLWVLVVGFFSATAAIYTTASDLNLLLAGEREAMHLGVDVTRVKLVVYISASVLTGLAVAVSGAIGYVGLLVPHLMRMLFGSDYRLLIPTSAIGGAIAVVLADTLARTVVAPTELPVGAMTAMAGAPFFIYLLRRRLA